MKTLATFLLAALSVPAASWTDRAEYDLVLGIRAELLPQKRLALLDTWKAKYPKSEYQQARRSRRADADGFTGPGVGVVGQRFSRSACQRT